MTIERTVNYKLCKSCKGKNCCQEHGGIYSPSDFPEITIASVKRLLEEGSASISSCVFSDAPKSIYLYLCVPEQGKGPIDLFSLPAPCSFWNAQTGCKFKRVDKRPWSCATMEPVKNRECIRHYSIEDVLKDWQPYQKKLEKVVVQLTGKSSAYLIQKDAEKAYPELKKILNVYQKLPQKYYSFYVYLLSLGYIF